MNRDDLQKLFREKFNLRIQPHMSEYVAKKMKDSPEEIPVIGGDARTGIPQRQVFTAAAISAGIK